MSDAIDLMKAKRLVAVCIPSHDGRVSWETMFQLREEEELFRLLNLPWRLEPIVIAGNSLITHARSEAVHGAIERGAEAVMWIDSDMGWSSGAIARLLARNVDVIGAACPRKETDLNWNVSWLNGDPQSGHDNGLIEVDAVGTGFLLVKLRVFDALKASDPARPENLYRKRGSERRYAYFSAPGSWGEDSYFCHRWRKLGGKVWIDPAIAIEHVIAPRWSVKACLAEWLETQQLTEQAA